ncbi:NAD(P)-dependent oxidoreductase [Nocardioides pocheonensis]|uniref:NAD(P)-dependent oxidoreductase n=1 Tax=Nocardioides pocheonensis TaxID=661485 RepID=A0A3N0GIW5_9ACTN|nr:NAD(P)-dependent oxidoreductase [Nocardioides pocheonensis]
MQDGRVRVVVSGGTGVIGRAAVQSLLAAGHDVDVLSRSPENTALIESLGARACPADLFDPDSLQRIYAGADAVVNLASRVPVGYAAVWPGSWRDHDALRTTAVANVVAAARAAGVRRVVQESVSFLYADHGDAWITEQDSIEITPATEPSAVGESHVLGFGSASRAGVVLRFGSIVGDDAMTRFWLKAAASRRPVGVGRRDQWSHLVHTDDLGSAVLAALQAPNGVYNVGAAPVLRGELVDGYAKAVGVDSGAFLGPVLRRLAGPRVEPLTRSLRVSSDHFSAQTGWQPRRSTFDPAWFDAAQAPVAATS